MHTSGKKNNFPRKFFNEKILTGLLLVIIIFLSVPLYNNYQRRQNINRKISDLEEEIKQAENKDTDLQKLIKYLESDQFVEEQARLNLNMKKPGESVAVVNEQAQPDKIIGGEQINFSNPAAAGTVSGLGNVSGWWHYFFK